MAGLLLRRGAPGNAEARGTGEKADWGIEFKQEE